MKYGENMLTQLYIQSWDNPFQSLEGLLNSIHDAFFHGEHSGWSSKCRKIIDGSTGKLDVSHPWNVANGYPSRHASKSAAVQSQFGKGPWGLVPTSNFHEKALHGQCSNGSLSRGGCVSSWECTVKVIMNGDSRLRGSPMMDWMEHHWWCATTTAQSEKKPNQTLFSFGVFNVISWDTLISSKFSSAVPKTFVTFQEPIIQFHLTTHPFDLQSLLCKYGVEIPSY